MDDAPRARRELSLAFTNPVDDPLTPSRVLAWLDLLRSGVAARDEVFVWELLGYRASRAVPREVLEEALALVRAPFGSFRAPMVLLRFAYVMQRLAEAGEPLPGTGEPRDRPSAGGGQGAEANDDDPEATSPQLELTWPSRRSTAPRPHDHERRRPA